MEQTKRLGEIFVEQGILTPKLVERVLGIAERLNKRFGTVLEEMGLITGEELAVALATQYGCKTAFNIVNHSFPRELLNVIPGDFALQHHIFPLKVDKGRLALAMADPTATRVVENIAANNNFTVVPFVSPKKHLNAAICRHYFGMDTKVSVQKSVLIVEDDKLIINQLTDILSKDYQIYTAMDGMEGYKLAVSKMPNVILTDKEMPKFDGYALLSALRSVSETRTIPVILISGALNADLEAEALDKGFFDVIPKPAKPPTLLTRVKRAFNHSEQQYAFMR